MSSRSLFESNPAVPISYEDSDSSDDSEQSPEDVMPTDLSFLWQRGGIYEASEFLRSGHCASSTRCAGRSCI
ncbi:hypothetical protein V3C99_015127 [Haemonchus contortus]